MVVPMKAYMWNLLDTDETRVMTRHSAADIEKQYGWFLFVCYTIRPLLRAWGTHDIYFRIFSLLLFIIVMTLDLSRIFYPTLHRIF
jgi:hypothetical protein